MKLDFIIKDVKRFWLAICYSYCGLKVVLKDQWAFRWELLLCAIGIPVALCFGNSAAEKAVLIAVLILLLITEVINSAIEIIIDRIGLEQHTLSGRAKDVGCAAVFLASVNVVVVWLVVFLGR